jgi:LSD1 subclass zinc finger protein
MRCGCWHTGGHNCKAGSCRPILNILPRGCKHVRLKHPHGVRMRRQPTFTASGSAFVRPN